MYSEQFVCELPIVVDICLRGVCSNVSVPARRQSQWLKIVCTVVKCSL